MELLLDTSVLIDALRGRPVAGRLSVLAASTRVVPYVCAVNVEELWRGVRHDEEDALRRLLRGLRVAPLGLVEGELAGGWRREFARRGVTLSQADCLIAAAAVGIAARLATGNPKDYPMNEVTVDHWPVGA